MPFSGASEALARFTVLDLTRVRAGPTCVRQLADWGANVIKIEMPEDLEAGEPLGGPREGPDFQNLHRNKRAITLNLKSPGGSRRIPPHGREGRRRGRELPARREGPARHRLRVARKINPRLVYASISGFGQDGPYRDRPGFDQIAQGMGGLMSITGQPGHGPMRVGIPVADLCAGLFCGTRHPDGAARARAVRQGPVGAELAPTGADLHAGFPGLALAQRGRGAAAGRQQSSDQHPDRRVQDRRRPYQHRHDGPENLGTVLRAPSTRRSWSIIADYDNGPLRSKNRDALNAEIDKRTVSRTSADWVERFNKAGVPSGPIYAIDQMFADPQVQHLGIAKDVPKANGAEAARRWPADRAVAHAKHDRGGAARARRAYRRGSCRVRLQAGRNCRLS